MTGGVEGIGLGIEDMGHHLLLLGQLFFIRLHAHGCSLTPRHNRHGLGRLLATHDTHTGIGKGIEKIWIVATATHAIVTSTKAGTGHKGDARYIHIAHRLNHLRAVLDHARLLRLSADNVAGGILEKQRRDIGLI